MTPVAELLTAYRPHFAKADYRLVDQWIAEGRDLERDVLPVIREWTEGKPDVHSLGFFARYVWEARDKPEAVHRRARTVAFQTPRLDRCMPTDERWPEGYEAEYGIVTQTLTSREGSTSR